MNDTCHLCERPLPPRAVMCPFCGAPVAERTVPAPSMPMPLAVTDDNVRIIHTPPPEAAPEDMVAPDDMLETIPQGSRARTPHADLLRTATDALPLGATPTPAPHRPEMVVMGDAVKRKQMERRLWPWAMALLTLAVVAAAVLYARRPHYAPLEVLRGADADQTTPCEGQARCVVVYLAPWCPASQRTVPALARLREMLPEDVGLTVVVGATQDKDAASAMATAVGDAWLDPQERFLDAMKPRVLPAWYALDDRGAITAEVEGTYLALEGQLDLLKL